MKYRYRTLKNDWNFLRDLDFGGDYVDVESNCFELMAHPNKEEAKILYYIAIKLWFDSLKTSRNGFDEVNTIHKTNKKVISIGKKYGHLT